MRFLENLPFVMHSFVAEILSTSGFVLLEQPLFYLVLLFGAQCFFNVSDLVGDGVLFVL